MENINRKFYLIITLQIVCMVLILLGGGFIYKTIYNLHNIPVEAPTLQPEAQTASTSTYTFDQVGTFVFNSNNEQASDTWYLLYDTPQQSGNVVQLVFSRESICMDSEQKILTCNLGIGFRSGLRVRVVGNKIPRENIVQVAVLSQVSQ